uniref:F-box/LRR-repeat protein 4 n=1 Tax=Cacopsylla melanoneura TaxID=428564 RepID=A0A8D8XHW1_9HEMI
MCNNELGEKYNIHQRMGDLSEFTDGDGLDSNPTKDNITIYKQYVQDVLDFSSQYGSDISISYTAYNILGKPSKYPDYGDFPQTFVVRTYGKWWNEAPSRPVPIMPQNFGPIVSQDYIDLSFEVAVFPFSVRIYETYNPGSVVRIWAGDRCGRWKVLWEGAPQAVSTGSRVFRPRIKPINFPTKLIRLEFDQSSLDYYTELDAVLLVGTREPISPDSPLFTSGGGGEYNYRQQSGGGGGGDRESRKVNMTPFHNLVVRDLDRILQTLELDPRTTTPLSLSPPPPSPPPPPAVMNSDVTRCRNGRFSILPDEVVLHILSHLDLLSLYRVSQLNVHLNRLATDPTLYVGVSLRPYWPRVNSACLSGLAQRAPLLQRLDLGWCGNYGTVDVRAFTRLIDECGKLLTHLRLDCCKFVDNVCVERIAQACRNLKELTLRNCSKIDSKGFAHLATISTLERLDLYRTSIETQPLVNILRNSPRLKHINLGSCVKVSSMDEVAQALGEYNLHLISVDFWKTYSLTPVGVRAIARCTKLEEVDFGWCLGVSIPGDCLSLLAASCPGLRKLFMVALRGILDKDLDPFIQNCRRLEQVDLLGVRSISQEVCLRFLSNCPHLRLLDVSFCDHISEADVQEWRLRFPLVSIKRSFQNENYNGILPIAY